MLALALQAAACVTARAQVQPEDRPALDVPPVPPRVIEPLPPEPPPIEPVGELPTAPVNPPRAKPPARDRTGRPPPSRSRLKRSHPTRLRSTPPRGRKRRRPRRRCSRFEPRARPTGRDGKAGARHARSGEQDAQRHRLSGVRSPIAGPTTTTRRASSSRPRTPSKPTTSSSPSSLAERAAAILRSSSVASSDLINSVENRASQKKPASTVTRVLSISCAWPKKGTILVDLALTSV